MGKKNNKKSKKEKKEKKKEEISEEELEEVKKESIKTSKKTKKELKKKNKKELKKEKKSRTKKTIVEEEEEEKETSKKRVKKEKKEKKPDKKDKEKEEKEEEVKNIKTVISKSGVIVDPYVPSSQNYHVVKDENGDFNSKDFSCTLNKSNLEHNNNKYYIIQLLQSDINGNYYLFLRWGRVGVKGENKFEQLPLKAAISKFISKYKDKTRRGYKEIIIDYSNEEEEKEEEKKKNKKQKKDQDNKLKDELNKLLSEKVIEFINLIYNTGIINQQMKEIGYDSSKMPLGKLAKESLEKGYLILKDIEKELQSKSPSKSTLTKLSSDFFTYIPHDFGFKKMHLFIIDSLEEVRKKIDMIDTLKHMKVATKIIEDNSSESETSLLLNYYKQLHCEIKHISENDEIFKLLEKYLKVKLKDSNDYYWGNRNLKLLEAYSIKREGEEERFLNNLNNKMLLWHGTRISNFVGILSQGLKIAPPEAPSSGYLFGKGLYFADMALKSCNYCYPVNNIGLILLCEVALGNIEKRNSTDYNLPNTMIKGNNSIQGVGAIYPKSGIYIDKDVYVPCENPVSKGDNFYGVTYNEFIVYDVKQVKLRYALKIQFDY